MGDDSKVKDAAEICDGRRQGDPTSNPAYTVTLTVAHLDADGGPCRCAEEFGVKFDIEEHLKAMCNRCHLV